eukprot:GHVU01135690.1.p1 GENE.GHVU01135690.1~~GHVU01135690.1.p1  ORF type:complete len:539 (+),score=30.16 GHVU01135690.1:207-1823(+)
MASIYDKASLVLIPSGTKTSKVYSQKPVNGDGDFTFSRSTAATRVNADGNIEKETQNLLTYSNTFNQWSPTRGTLSQGVTDPFGGNNAWSLTATDNDPYLYNQTAWSGVAILSIWAKGVGSSIGKPIQLRMGGSFEEFTLTGDWQRFEKFTNGSASNIGIEVPNPAVAGDVVHIYGAQLEYGLVARDYIETTTAAVEGGITDNVPRLDYTDSSCPALLLEPQRTNFIPYSEYFGDWALDGDGAGQSVTANYSTSPEGVQNAYRLQLNKTGGTYSRIRKSVTSSYSGAGIFSVYLKTNDGSTKTLSMRWGGSGVIEKTITGEWQRFDVQGTATNGLAFDCEVFLVDAANSDVVDLSIYGAMQEAGSYATSYIPTYGTSVTRNADSCLKTGISSLIGQTEGTLFLEFKDEDYSFASISRGLSISDGTYNNRIYISQLGGGNMYVIGATGGTSDLEIQESVPSGRRGTIKAALSYSNNNYVLYVNGSLAGSDTSASVPACSNIYLGQEIGLTSNSLNKPYNQVLLFKTRLSNEELAALTTI